MTFVAPELVASDVAAEGRHRGAELPCGTVWKVSGAVGRARQSRTDE